MLRKIALLLLAAVLVLVAVVASRPSDWQISRSVVLQAPPDLAYGQVADFHRWKDWSPWAKLDPNMKEEHGGPYAGLGATYHWTGNDKVGEGRMTVTAARPPFEAVIRLEFIKPWAQVSTTTFTFAPDGVTTKVTWAMAGTYDFMGKLFTLFMDMDKQVGPDFERGLSQLRAVVEAKAAAARAAEAADAGPATAPAAQ